MRLRQVPPCAVRRVPGRGIGQPVSDHDHAPFGAESRAESNDLALSGTVGSQQRCSRQRRETTVTPCSRRTAGRSCGVHWRSRSGPGSYPDGWWCRVRAVWTVITRWTTGVIRRRHSSPCVQHHAAASVIHGSGSDRARLARAPCTPDDRPAPSVRKWGSCGRGRHPFPHAGCTPPSSPAAVRGDPGPPLVAMRPAPCHRIRDPEERLGPRPQVLVRQRVGDLRRADRGEQHVLAALQRTVILLDDQSSSALGGEVAHQAVEAAVASSLHVAEARRVVAVHRGAGRADRRSR